MRRAAVSAALYLAAGVFGVAGLASAHVLAYRLLGESIGDDAKAAAILVGADLFVVLLILAARAIYLRKERPGPLSISGTRPSKEAASLTKAGLEAGIALGGQIREKARKSTPKIALIAGVAGLILGLRPELLGLLRRRPPRRER